MEYESGNTSLTASRLTDQINSFLTSSIRAFSVSDEELVDYNYISLILCYFNTNRHKLNLRETNHFIDHHLYIIRVFKRIIENIINGNVVDVPKGFYFKVQYYNILSNRMTAISARDDIDAIIKNANYNISVKLLKKNNCK